VVNGLAETDARFGLVPVGSGNDLALALGIPADVPRALDVIATGRDAAIDLGRWNEGWFANSLGLGFEAQVTLESRKIRRLRGFAIYLWALAKALRGLRCPDLVVRADVGVPGGASEGAIRTFTGRRLLLCVGNGPRVGGGFLLTPDADPADGLFDLCLVDGLNRRRVLRTLPGALSGTHTKHSAVTMLRARSVEIESAEGFPFHTDGEVQDGCRHSLRVELVPAGLRVRVPAAASG
jgi:diacylglycerol kinase (ATP)